MRFVCRWRDETPFSKRVVTLPDATVLDWFRRGWDFDDPEGWVESELGGDVYGLDSIFEEAREQSLSPPDTVDELRELLHEHLWVEGEPEDCIRLGEHALRVRTDDDEVDLAYYFIDDEAVAASPDRLAYLLHDSWPLPAGAAPAGAEFDPGVPVRIAPPAGPDRVYSVRLSWPHHETGTNLDLAGAMVFPGLLPELAGYLRGVDDHRVADARLLRALVEPPSGPPSRTHAATSAATTGPPPESPPGDANAESALRRYAGLAGYDPSPADLGKDNPRSLISADPHIVQVARHIDDFFGYDQWFLFDTRWAAAHPDLARSLLRYAAHWDPFQL
ncbi:hypothetical protein [Paractinoplanes durhamensis]|uniref:Uncharacterized protein n=1 Tax=Paractinoplanes durhamensis TaxID=113563 RepID=A0ABQ3ZA81_9ACTN|nr:hypothetical protein [Actinoplanes durhamensis]GIE06738.1 hypothetical protein Adu01nite_80880 [Actinoplanes durhamensis]